VQLVQYTVLSDKILIWVIRDQEISVVKEDTADFDLREKVRSFVETLKSGSKQSGENELLAEDLYRILISPVEEKLDRQKVVCLIPDKILSQLPFGALFSASEGKFLIAKYTLMMSPSVNIFLNSSKKAESLASKSDEKLLSVGNPSFSKNDFPDLSNLEAAEKEAKEIVKYYKDNVGNILLTKNEAKKEAVKPYLLLADVVHFAGHYVVDEKNPLSSGLIFSEDVRTREKKDSILANHEILTQRFPNIRLIILSACETGIELFYNAEGLIGAARTFLASGVPVVVASQWKVDSAATYELMVRFHRYRKEDGVSTPEALRRAQLDLLNGENKHYRNPRYWAAFTTLGGYSRF
jgi:CHAT domain-containing protein